MNRLSLIVAFLLVVCFACDSPKFNHPHAVIKTSLGDIEVELYTDKAPLTAGAFLRYADSGYYKKSNFYRILNAENQPSNAIKAQLIQGGLWRSNNKLATSLPGIPHESTKQTGVLHKKGILSMARLGPGTAGAEFFICMDDEPGFDFGGENNADGLGYAAFGKVVSGFNIVQLIYNRPEHDQSFDPRIDIYDIEVK